MITAKTIRASGFPTPLNPFAAELFSVERLEQHAESLAAAQTVTPEPVQGRPLLPRVVENGRVLLEYYRVTSDAIRREQTITPATEWLVDNFYIVEEQLREIRDDLPRASIARLLKLASGHLEKVTLVFSAWPGHLLHTPTANFRARSIKALHTCLSTITTANQR